VVLLLLLLLLWPFLLMVGLRDRTVAGAIVVMGAMATTPVVSLR